IIGHLCSSLNFDPVRRDIVHWRNLPGDGCRLDTLWPLRLRRWRMNAAVHSKLTKAIGSMAMLVVERAKINAEPFIDLSRVAPQMRQSEHHTRRLVELAHR